MRSSILYNPGRFITAYLTGWLIWAMGQTVIIHKLGYGWEESIKDGAMTAVLLAITCFAAITLYKYYQPGKENRIYRLFFAIGISVLFCVLFRWSIPLVFSKDDAYLYFLEASLPLRFAVSFLMIGFITILNWMWNSLHEQKEFDKRRSEAEQLVKEAELVKLRQQLQPHFLFNSLNSISALAGSKPEEARRMVQQLSDFLRGTLRKDEQELVPLGEEIQHLKLYLEIEKVRFGHRLGIEVNVPDESLKAVIPPLLLQPIVENAIKFGLYGTIDDIVVSIEAAADPNFLSIEVKNPFDAATQGGAKGTGFGLNSIQRRLFLLYGRNDLLTTDRKETIFITRLKIPQQQLNP